MPLPSDERLVALATDLLSQFDKLFGLHPGFRAAHAKGLLLSGTFTPSAEAAGLTKAPHVVQPSTPVFVRYSNSTGLPQIPDSAPEANPRGMAVRFQLGEHQHTDIVAHSTDGFPTKDGAGFLKFLEAAGASGPDVPSPKPIEKFLGENPSALAFVQAPKPFPVSFATDTYFGVTAFEFENAAGEKKFGRYRWLPEAGNHYLEQGAAIEPNYHFDEIAKRVKDAPVKFKLVVQVAEPGDVTDDNTQHWPEDRKIVELGVIAIDAVVAENAKEQQHVIFDPIPRVEGIEPSGDPLLELRAAIYLLSGRRRRQAPPTA